jgi:hypothetical protein
MLWDDISWALGDHGDNNYGLEIELISLGVLALVPYGVLLMNVCPLFLVSKPGQPDQWRCITYMKKGHQNQ